MKVALICGARPNFMKVAPVLRALKAKNIQAQIIHTGQHYDYNMSKSFFDKLGIPDPNHHLDAGGGSHAEQTGKIMVAFEKVCKKEAFDWVVVVGDVNSTLACSITSKKLQIPVAHIEAGLRSWDWAMPEEVNRVVTDSISDLFFTTDPDGNKNLKASGVSAEKIHFVGNVMIDSLLQNIEQSKSETILNDYQLRHGEYALLTLHRPSNVDQLSTLEPLLKTFFAIQSKLPILFPAHPRTLSKIKEFELHGMLESMQNLIVCDPLNYHEMIQAIRNSKLVLTDSGGLQEETTVLGIPCITLRENTERPITVEKGTSELVGSDPLKIQNAFHRVESGGWKKGSIPDGWDGKAADRIAEIFSSF